MVPESELTKSQREFIGTQLPTPKGGVLTVVGVSSNKLDKTPKFICECNICSAHKTIFPLGSFQITKGSLLKGSIPCACSKKPMFDDNLMEKLTQEFLNHEMPNLTVLGSERVKGKPLNFILSCDKCSQDEELWPYGSIKSTRGNLIKGQVPCGCTNRRSMTRNQYEILINRKADTLGYKFVGFKGGWCGGSTQLELYNESTNNYWDVPKITDFLRDGRVDPEERKVNTSNRMVVEDAIHIENFMSTGKFLDGTQFWRSSKENIKGYKTYWNYTCPVCSNDEYVKAGVCSGIFETLANSLKKGVVGCRCSKAYRWTQNQREYQL